MIHLEEAVANGARKHKACEVIGLSVRTYYRWKHNPQGDLRPHIKRPSPPNTLSHDECLRIIECCNTPEFSALPPAQIVPKLADKSVYLGSESTFYRVLKANKQLAHRGKSKPKTPSKLPTTYIAQQPNEVWSWDISYLKTAVAGQFYYLYLIMDIFSRCIVGAEVFKSESGEDAAALLQRAMLNEKTIGKPIVLHSDNGAPMKCFTMKAKMKDLGVIGSRSRPRVSNDNPYSEALFKTVKYCPSYPEQGFLDIEAAQLWVSEFVSWYNEEHQHSGIRYVTPSQRHQGKDKEILEKRKAVYAAAKAQNPDRWSGDTRNWAFTETVALNPEKIDH